MIKAAPTSEAIRRTLLVISPRGTPDSSANAAIDPAEAPDT